MPYLETQFAHLGLNATATVEPPFDGMAWYAGYEQRQNSGDTRIPGTPPEFRAEFRGHYT